MAASIDQDFCSPLLFTTNSVGLFAVDNAEGAAIPYEFQANHEFLPPSAASFPITAWPLQTVEGTHSSSIEPAISLEGTRWSQSDPKEFENLLDNFVDDMPGQWEKIASDLGGPVSELEENYQPFGLFAVDNAEGAAIPYEFPANYECLPPSGASVPGPSRPLQTVEGTHSSPVEPTISLEGTRWSQSDPKEFENLLDNFVDDMPGQWEKIASELGGPVSELEENYQPVGLFAVDNAEGAAIPHEFPANYECLPPSGASVPGPSRPLQTVEGTHSSPVEPTISLEGTKWSLSDQKKFENLLANFVDDMPGQLEKMASELGRPVSELEENYQALLRDILLIESDIERASADSALHVEPKRKRKKAVPWTPQEHKLFLIALRKYKPGDWRSISRNAVRTRTPMQVASHAQKYHERLKFNEALKLDDTKKKKRKSIHDLTIEELEQLVPEKKEHQDIAEII